MARVQHTEGFTDAVLGVVANWRGLGPETLAAAIATMGALSSATITADNVVVDPAVQGGIEVQAALTALDANKSAVGHTHAASTVTFTPAAGLASTDVQAALAELGTGKAATVHGHAITDVAGLQGALDAKVAIGTAYAASVITNAPAGNIAATTVQAALNELDAEKSAVGHTHAASAISVAPAGNITTTNVQAALSELDTKKAAVVHSHVIGDVSGLQTALDAKVPVGTVYVASAITNTPAGGIAATTVQAALNELDTEKSSVGHTHAASEINNTPAGGIAAITVQAALNELDTEKSPVGHVHAASAITVTPTSDMAQTDVQGALAGRLSKVGGTLTGALVLAANAVNPLEAVPKQQLDTATSVATLATNLANTTVKAAIYARHRELGFISLADPIFGGLSSSNAAQNRTTLLAAVSALALIGGGNIVIPNPGFDIPINSMAVDNTWGNINIAGWGKPTLHCTSGRGIFDYGGVDEYLSGGAQLTGVARAGTKTVTLLSSSDPLKPAAGNMVVIISSSTNAVVSITNVPYGEWNEIDSVVGAVVNLKYPLRHTFFPAFNTDADYRIIVVGNRPKNFNISGLRLIHDAGAPYEVHGMFIKVRDCYLEGLAGLICRGRFIDAEYECNIPTTHWYDGAVGRRAMVLARDTTDTDGRSKFTAHVGGMGYLHIHEDVCHQDIDATVVCTESEPDVNALSVGLLDLSSGCHTINAKIEGVNFPKSYGVNIGGNSFSKVGPRRVRVAFTASGTAAGAILRSTEVATTAPGFPIETSLTMDGLEAATIFSDAGLTFGRNVLAVPIDRSLMLATAPATAGAGLDGKNVVTLPDGSTTSSASWQADLASSYTSRKKVRLVVQLACTTHGTGLIGDSEIRLDLSFGQNTAGTGIASWGTAVSNFPIFGRAGCPVYASGTFDVDSTKGRCGILASRLPATGADVFAANPHVRKMWMVFFDPLAV